MKSRTAPAMAHESLGLVESEPVNIGGRFAFQACFDFVSAEITVDQARQNFELRAYSKLARHRAPNRETALMALDLASLAFPAALEAENNSSESLTDAARKLGLANRDTRTQPSPCPAVIGAGASSFSDAIVSGSTSDRRAVSTTELPPLGSVNK